ncbi:hypothetical protein [Leadbetterella byssophila]|uniref:Rod shape-determining protein MreD n=1 Tax=Leadbetterella byssophila (strain DSM 17132 / JCM 16389 / KACC 11308 / NBRC 106382 / 4M15) TaxID=649349 RepID=E4RRE9_LEAB4|nr:hypothetical protein [Leadbetterella byssophila]ADQ18482.1 hypothetical protein Lbys_2820 [Leadbetterella byssophila DSM 17132]
MNSQAILRIGGSIIIYTLLQVFILRNLVFFDVAFCFVYISVILFLPSSVPTSTALIIAFVTGIMVDMFYNTAGLHASAALIVAYIRGFILKVLFPSRGLENEIVISIEGMGMERFIRYIVIMTFLHHTYLFFVEAGTFTFFINTTLKILASVMFSSIVIFLLHVYLKSLRNS